MLRFKCFKQHLQLCSQGTAIVQICFCKLLVLLRQQYKSIYFQQLSSFPYNHERLHNNACIDKNEIKGDCYENIYKIQTNCTRKDFNSQNYPVADPGDVAPQMGPNSFVFAYVFAKKRPCRRLACPPLTHGKS